MKSLYANTYKAIKLHNTIGCSAAGSIVVGRTLRETARFYDATEFTYDQILVVMENALKTAAFAAPQIQLLETQELKCGVLDYYQHLNQYPQLQNLSTTFDFLLHFETVNPLESLHVKIMPAVMKLNAKEMNIDLKLGLKCLYRRSVPASTNLFRAIDTLVTMLIHRLDITNNVLRLATKY